MKAVFDILRQRRVVVCACCIDCKRNAHQTGKIRSLSGCIVLSFGTAADIHRFVGVNCVGLTCGKNEYHRKNKQNRNNGMQNLCGNGAGC